MFQDGSLDYHYASILAEARTSGPPAGYYTPRAITLPEEGSHIPNVLFAPDGKTDAGLKANRVDRRTTGVEPRDDN